MFKYIKKQFTKFSINLVLNDTPTGELEDLLVELRYVKVNNIRRHGICYSINHGRSILKRLFPYWPEYSGNETYPIKSYKESFRPNEAYNTLALWDTTTEYGQARVRLLNWLIKVISKYLEK